MADMTLQQRLLDTAERSGACIGNGPLISEAAHDDIHRQSSELMIEAAAALESTPAQEPLVYIVTNGQGNRFRAWEAAGPCWTEDRMKAVRFARREDAEAVFAEDEDAWGIVPLDAALSARTAPAEGVNYDREIIASILRSVARSNPIGFTVQCMEEQAELLDSADNATSTARTVKAEGDVQAFINLGGSEANFIADAERLNCPACSGSGHIDDATANSVSEDADRYRWIRKYAQLSMPGVKNGINSLYRGDSTDLWDSAIDTARTVSRGDA